MGWDVTVRLDDKETSRRREAFAYDSIVKHRNNKANAASNNSVLFDVGFSGNYKTNPHSIAGLRLENRRVAKW